MNEKVTLGTLAQMKRDGRKIVGVVAWDYRIAAIADRAGVEIVSVGDSVGVNLWGHRSPLEVTMEQMLDGRVRMAHAAIGYAARTLDDKPDSYAQVTMDTLSALAQDVRAGRHIKGDAGRGSAAAPRP